MDAQIKDIGIFCDFILDGNQEEITQEVLDTAFSGGFRNVRKPNGRDKHFNLGTASCTYKHMQALRDIVKNNIPYGVVFENDIILDKKFTDILFKAIAEIKERSLKNLVVSLEDTMLKYVPRSKRVKGQLIYPSPTGYIRFAGAYLFDLEYAKNMLNYVDTNGIDDVIDWLINNRQAQGGGYMGIYWLHPTIAVGGSVTGDIGSYFTNRRYYGFFRKMSRLSQKVYKTILWNLR
ncbi:MAG: glycosyltransferase family 25 protein [Elusimicrobia bacterium]|nr:glycosyltransferase family 25 protein [Elusimicrobiota bacterium]